MSKFHVNDKGEPGKCSAEVSCPFGSDDKHYPSPEVARQAYEESNSHQQIPTISKRIADFARGGEKPAISIHDYSVTEYDHLLYDEVAFDEERRTERARRVVAHNYRKRSLQEREEIVQEMMTKERAAWYRESEIEPVVSFQRQAPARLVPVGVEIMGDDGDGGRKVIGRVEEPSIDDSGEPAVCYSDLAGKKHYVSPNHPLDLGAVPEPDPAEPWGPWEREKRHAIRLAASRSKFDQNSRAIRAKNGS